MIKLVAIDMDGTLLDSQKQLAPENIRAINAVAAKGVKVVVCTGRPMTGVKPYFDQLGLDRQEYLIINNGCSTYDTANWDLIAEHHLTADELERLDATMKEHPELQLTLVDDQDNYFVIADSPSELVAYDASLVFTQAKPITLDELLKRDALYFEVMIMGEQTALNDYQNKWEKVLSSAFSLVRSQDYIYEILPKEVSKATALAELVAKLGYTADQVMAIGDANNDIEMLEFATHSVAMGNSPDHIKQLARYLTTSNDECGVAHALTRWILEDN